MLGRAAHAAGLRPAEPWVVDDLQTADEGLDEAESPGGSLP
jgi:hypothetical protein